MASVTTSTNVCTPTLRICNGPGEIYECDAPDIPAGDCDCDGNQLDVRCLRARAADADMDGVVTPTNVSTLDACGTCNGPGDLRMRCSDIPAGDCDCDGNQLMPSMSAGSRAADADMDGICDDVDDCVGEPTLAACATALARFTNADVQTFQQEIATVTATNSMP